VDPEPLNRFINVALRITLVSVAFFVCFRHCAVSLQKTPAFVGSIIHTPENFFFMNDVYLISAAANEVSNLR